MGELIRILYCLFVAMLCLVLLILVKVKWSRYRPGVDQKVGRGIALPFHYRGTRRGWVVSSTLRPHFTPRKDPVPIVQEAGWSLGPVWTGRKSRPHRDSIPDRPARSQSLYRLSYPAHRNISGTNPFPKAPIMLQYSFELKVLCLRIFVQDSVHCNISAIAC